MGRHVGLTALHSMLDKTASGEARMQGVIAIIVIFLPLMLATTMALRKIRAR